MTHFSERTWRTVAERLIVEAIERGEFDDLPGKGKPIPEIDAHYDPNWWVKQKIRGEQIKVSRAFVERMNDRRRVD